MDNLRTLPWLLALFVGILAGVTLAHALVLTVRQRRRDLALLSVLGLSRWGKRRVTAFSTLVIGLWATVLGVPAGLIGGRLLWDQLATGAGLAPGPVRSWAQPIVIAVGVLAMAQLVNLLATRQVTSARPALILRAE